MHGQPLSSDPSRIVPVKPPSVTKQHPAMKAAKASWNDLHAGKFAENAGRFGKQKKT